MAILHLERESNDWWFHGRKTLGHDQISSYEYFSKALVERFNRKYRELPFKELAQLTQTGFPESYMLEFQNLLVMVSDIYMAQLVPLYIKGLEEPLKGLVKPTRK